MSRLSFSVLLATGLIFCAQIATANVAQDIKTFTLDNGMKIIVLEDHSIPNANMYTFWKVGSRNEVPGITGISHFFEHMMFNGAKKYGPKMFDRTMEAAGGANNAYTSENVTVYTDWFPASSLALMFELEADRIGHLAIDEEMVESERGVVASERTTGLENSNIRSIMEAVKASAFRAHPYSWSVIGHESDIQNWSLDDLVQYYQTYYAPNNAVVVIAGDVKFEEVKALANTWFAPIPAQTPPKKVTTVEPAQNGERRVYEQKESVSTPNVMFAYHVPATSHPDYYALELLESILIEGNSSRLYQALVDKQIAVDAGTYFPVSFDPNLFYFFAVASPEVSAETLEKAMITTIAEVKKNGVSDNELQKAKNLKLMNFYQAMQTINGKANTIGTYELFFGSYHDLFNAPEAYNKVTLEDIQRVAQTYLVKKNRTVGVLAAEEDTDQ